MNGDCGADREMYHSSPADGEVTYANNKNKGVVIAEGEQAWKPDYPPPDTPLASPGEN